MSENINLKSNYLSFVEIIAQSIGSIAPTASLAFVIPLVFGAAGNGTWLVYLFALIAILLVSFNINKFASRSASEGSLYSYIVYGLGPTIGFVSGWALLLGYGLTASAVLSGFINFTNQLLKYINVNIPLPVIGIIGAALAWRIAYKDIKLSAKLTLIFEGISVGIILILGIIVVIRYGLQIDFDQLTLKNVSINTVRQGLVIAFFSFVGFESAASLGGEAKNPLKTIPKSIIISTIIVGVIFVSFSYIEIIGYFGSNVALNEAEAPLAVLAENNSVGFFGPILSLGTLFSFWASFLACINAGARILLKIIRDNNFSSRLGLVHKDNQTPYIAISVIVIISTLIPITLIICNYDISEIYGWIGTLATFGLIFNYLLITIAAPFYLKKNNLLTKKDIVLSAITIFILLIPLVGSVYPVQDYPYNLFPLFFVIWIVLGGAGFVIRNKINEKKDNIIDIGLKEE